MSKTTLFSYLQRAVLFACLAGSEALWSLEQDAAPGDPPAVTAGERTFREAIAHIESSQGAYAPALPEQLLSLGLALQAQNRHEEAVDLLKRGVHLTRINDGLYSEQQIPLLQGEISSHMALGKYAVADERQRYLYRVQVRSMSSGQPRAMAFMQQANWQFNAYQLRLGETAFPRLMHMWDLYRLALNDILGREGDKSPQLLSPLRGMLQAQYLISSYDPQTESPNYNPNEDLGARQEMNRFNAYRAQSYNKGSAVIRAIYEIEQQHQAEQSIAATKALIMLGDWQLWHEQRDEALETYQDAIRELAERDDAQIQMDQIFGEPVALPDMDGVRPMPPEVGADQGDILLEFGVNARGRVVHLERLEVNEERVGSGNRLMRKLRKTPFRPRFAAGEPVETENIVKAYEIE